MLKNTMGQVNSTENWNKNFLEKFLSKNKMGPPGFEPGIFAILMPKLLIHANVKATS